MYIGNGSKGVLFFEFSRQAPESQNPFMAIVDFGFYKMYSFNSFKERACKGLREYRELHLGVLLAHTPNYG